MRITEKPKIDHPETILPLINIVFLLLIFILLMGQITDHPTIPIEPAQSVIGNETQNGLKLFIDKNGDISFQAHHGREQVLAAIAEQLKTTTSLPDIIIKADAKANFANILSITKNLEERGAQTISLEVRKR